MGPLTPLFWTSSDVSSGFQNQDGLPCLCALSSLRNWFLRRTSVHFLPTSRWSAWQLISFVRLLVQVLVTLLTYLDVVVVPRVVCVAGPLPRHAGCGGAGRRIQRPADVPSSACPNKTMLQLNTATALKSDIKELLRPRWSFHWAVTLVLHPNFFEK